MKKIPILLDTDIGGDVDDALALALALRSPELELRAITTVSRNAPQRANSARELFRHFAPERTAPPIVAGHSSPLVKAPDVSARDENDRPDAAIDLMASEITKAAQASERLTVVAIGPLTNIAILLTRHPELNTSFDLILMGGNWSGDRTKPEWNINLDPEAAAIVFKSGVPLRMVGLDVTRHCTLSEEEVSRFDDGNDGARYLASLIKKWNRKTVLHDPLTLLALFTPCVKFAPKRIEIPLTGEKRAWTLPVEGTPNVEVAAEVDAVSAKAIFLERVLN